MIDGEDDLFGFGKGREVPVVDDVSDALLGERAVKRHQSYVAEGVSLAEQGVDVAVSFVAVFHTRGGGSKKGHPLRVEQKCKAGEGGGSGFARDFDSQVRGCLLSNISNANVRTFAEIGKH